MAIAIPALRSSTQQVLYGFSRIISCLTKITLFNNSSEQRIVARAPLYKFILPMNLLSDQDRAAWLSYFSDPEVLGQYGTTGEVTLNGVTYSDLTLESDRNVVVNRVTGRFDQVMRLRQVKPANPTSYTPPSVGSTYPNLKFGAATTTDFNSQLPFTQTSRFRTSGSNSEYGQQYNYPWWGNSLNGFPTLHMRSWTLDYPLLTDADLLTVETYFLGKRGRYATFDFIDPLDNTVIYHNVRFDQDDLEIKYVAPNHNSATVRLIQTNG